MVATDLLIGVMWILAFVTMEGLVTVTAIVLNAPALMDMQERTVKYLQVYTVTLTYEPMVDIPSLSSLCLYQFFIWLLSQLS